MYKLHHCTEVTWVWQHVTSLLPASTMTQACTRLFFFGPESAGPVDAASAAAVGAASAAAAAAAASLGCCCFCIYSHDVRLADQHNVNVLSSAQPIRVEHVDAHWNCGRYSNDRNHLVAALVMLDQFMPTAP